MKPETLESLLLDRALGELDAETQELLGEYLAGRSADAARALHLEQTVAAARDAVRIEPAARGAPLRCASAAAAWWRVRPEIVRLAACVALGALVGWAAHGTLPPGHERSAASAALRPPASGALLPLSATVGGEDLSAARPQPPPLRSTRDYPRVARYRLRWDSPMNRPNFEEKP